MPSFDDYRPQDDIVKGMLIGYTGTGKTGSVAALCNVGYRVCCIDYDNGLDLMRDLLTPEAKKRFFYETFQDNLIPYKTGVSWVGVPMAYSRSLELLERWRMPERKLGDKTIPAYDLGRVQDWGPDTILLIDSLTIQGNCIMRYHQGQQSPGVDENRKRQPSQNDWGQAQNYQERFVELLYGPNIKCNVLCTAHIRRVGGGGTTVSEDKHGNMLTRELDSIEGKGWPSVLGRALPPKVGRYFNTMLYYYTDENGMRWISTVPRENIDCKTPAPRSVKPTYSMATGLLDIFQAIRKSTGVPK